MSVARVPIWPLIKCLASAKVRSARRALSGYKRPHFELGQETPIQTFYEGPLFDPLGTRAGLKPLFGVPPYGLPAEENDVSWLRSVDELVFEVDAARSFFGDCINVVDAPDELPLDPTLPPFGWSRQSLTQGLAITCSPLRGTLRAAFSKPVGGFGRMTLSHGSGLLGVDGMLSTPSGYGIQVTDNSVHDAEPGTHAQLEHATGRLHDFHYNVRFANTAIDLLCQLNPGLTPPPLLFPGLPHAGHTMGWLEVEGKTNQLVLHIVAQQFLPLGPTVDGRPLQMPGTQTSLGSSTAFRAANTSLHPFISLVATADLPAGLRTQTGGAAPSRESYRRPSALPLSETAGSLADYQNQVVSLKCIPGSTDFGDHFALRSQDLGGGALARSPLFGHLRIQFGTVADGKLPFVIVLEGPTARLRSKTEQLLRLLPPGTQQGLLGMHGQLHFPKTKFEQHELSLTSDPYKVSVGVIDLASGEFKDTILRAYLFQNVMRNLLLAEPRTPTDSFCYVCDGSMQSTKSGLLFRLYGDFAIPYPTGYAFPLPGGRKTRIEAGSHLLPFVNIDAVSKDAFLPSSEGFEFISERHLRGRLDATASLIVRGTDGHFEAEIAGAAGITRLAVERMTFALLGELEVIELEMTLGGRDEGGEAVYGMVVNHGNDVQLLLVSEHETFDSWLGGSLVRASTA